MNEFDFIQSIKPSAYHQSSVIKGIGDDTAVFRQSSADIVTAVDTFVEGVHFTRETMNACDVGYRALAANISDIAAMGAMPAMCLVSVVFPPTWLKEERLDVMNGIKQIANQYKIDIVGGDTVSGDTFVLSITIIGYVHASKVRYRSTAEPNDIVFVTGTLGDASAGLALLLNEVNQSNHTDYLINRHVRPTPRVDFTQALQSLHRVTLNDVSDGIANECAEIAEASHVGIYLYNDLIPVSTPLESFPLEKQYQWKYFGGEDFEILGTVHKNDWKDVQRAGAYVGLNVTQIGKVIPGNGQVLLETNGICKTLPKKGYKH